MNGRVVIALVLILLGSGFMLDSYNIMSFNDIITDWWPIVIIAIGVSHISRKNPPILTGLIIIGVGTILQAQSLNIIDSGFWEAFWPMILVIIGISILFPGKKFLLKRYQHIEDGDLNINAFFSGHNKRIDDKNFRGGNISVMFGGIELDLSNANLSDDGAILNISVAFGGMEITIPENWSIKTSGTPVFGGYEDQTLNPEPVDNKQILYLNMNIIFGGIEIKNSKKHKIKY